MKQLIPFLLLACLSGACRDQDTPLDDTPSPSALYFPPTGTAAAWETTEANRLNWNVDEVENLYEYLAANSTRAFIVLKDGKIVLEKYWGNNLSNTAPFTADSPWYWASAGKTLTATLVGIAQQDGKLRIEDKTSEYLGSGWTAMPAEKENLVTIRHQLSMTTGLEYQVPDLNCTRSSCLTYRADAGAQWFYHNAPYTLLRDVVEEATQTDYNQYTQQKVGSVIGMSGSWIALEGGNTYFSTARDMARFGLLMLAEGTWANTPVLSDANYFRNMVNTSQDLNPAYGYFWWLNGKSSVIFPSLALSFNMELASNAPADLIAALGKNGQFINVVPSMNLVVIRMGEAPDNALVPIAFHNTMWEKLNRIVRP